MLPCCRAQEEFVKRLSESCDSLSLTMIAHKTEHFSVSGTVLNSCIKLSSSMLEKLGNRTNLISIFLHGSE